MSLYVLDTDTLTLFQRGHAAVLRNVFYHLADEMAITAVSAEEQISGRLAVLHKARTPADIALASRRVAETIKTLATWDILPLTVPAVELFQDLQRRKLNVGGNDLRTAAVAMTAGGVVVTRNLRDFRRVPGLRCEDWPRDEAPTP